MKGIGTGRVGIEVSESRARVEFERRFLLRELPDGLALQDEHLQITDNYLTATRLRLRKARRPRTNEWTLVLTQKFAPEPRDLSRTVVTDIHLSQYEYEVLSVFEGSNEIRKNRYPYEFEGRTYCVDVFLGDLRGLILAETRFAGGEELKGFLTPPFAAFDVTDDEMFTGARLVSLSAEDIRAELARRRAAAGGHPNSA